MSVTSYRDLLVWQKAMHLVAEIYRATADFPKHEIYGLASQTRRAVVSIPANIAEGHDRDATTEYLRHVSVGVGSLAELETLLLIAEQLGYLSLQTNDERQLECQRLGRMLRNLQHALRARIRRLDDSNR